MGDRRYLAADRLHHHRGRRRPRRPAAARQELELIVRAPERPGELTYPEWAIGTSLSRTRGEHRAVIGVGAECFARASAANLRWAVKTRSGFRVARIADGGARPDGPVTVGESALIRFGPIREKVRVVRVVDEPRRRGFAYGTLPQHPLIGEEAFLVEWRDDDRVEFVVRSFSRPNGWLWTLLWPAVALARQVVLRRYLRALVD